jgi:hypothetical protein
MFGRVSGAEGSVAARRRAPRGAVLAVVEQLRSRGHWVTAYVPHPPATSEQLGDDVTVVTGELRGAAGVDRAVWAPPPSSAPSPQ